MSNMKPFLSFLLDNTKPHGGNSTKSAKMILKEKYSCELQQTRPYILFNSCYQTNIPSIQLTGTTLLVLLSPNETEAKDLEAQALAFIAPSCKLLFLHGSFKEFNNCFARLRHTSGCSHRFLNLVFEIYLLQANWPDLCRAGKKT